MTLHPSETDRMADISGTIKEAVVDGVKVVGGASSQGMLNIVLVLVMCAFGLMIYVDRRDRLEVMSGQLRFYEAQGELNRQSIAGNTLAIQSLTVTVGKLDSSVTELRREVKGVGGTKGVGKISWPFVDNRDDGAGPD